MSVDENQAIVERLLDETIRKGNLDAIGELVHPDFVRHPGRRTRDAMKAGYRQLAEAFRNDRLVIDDLIAAGDKVVVRYAQHFTQRREWRGAAPSGKPLTLTSIVIHRIKDAKIAERWGCSDYPGLWKQLGVFPPIDQVSECTWD